MGVGVLLLIAALLVGCGSDDTDDSAAMDGGDVSDGSVGGAGDAGIVADGGGDSATTAEPTGSTTVATALADGCSGQQLREGIDPDPSVRGPWPVGAVTTMLGGIVTEVWYPAEQGSEAGLEPIDYDLREFLPESDQGLIPDDRTPLQHCDCFRDLPIDGEAGPYPVVVFIHGTAGFRSTNMENVTHWASRGFVVVSSDHPGISLKEMLGMFTGGGSGMTDQAGDARRVLMDLEEPSGEAALLVGHLDLSRVGVMGHSAGAGAASALGDVADVLIPYAGGSPIAADRVSSVLHVIGDLDTVATPSTDGYDGTTTPTRRLTFIAGGGHMVGGGLCLLRDPSDPSIDILDLAVEFQIGGALAPFLPAFFGMLFQGCNELPDDDEPFIAATRGVEILNYLSTGVLEETLHCSSTSADALAAIESVYGDDIADYRETLP